MFYVYILKCKDGSLYTGYTNDIEKRIRLHNEGKGAKYTRSRRPVKLFAQRSFANKSEAMRYEAMLKSLPRKLKINEIKKSQNN